MAENSGPPSNMKDRRFSSISREEVPMFQDERSDLTPSKSIVEDEEQPLLGDSSESTAQTLSAVEIASIIAVILLGEFLASMDGTFVTAAGPTISSHFSRLEDLNWLTTAYLLGVAVVQPTIGKLSDIFGRKAVLLVSYFMYTLGRTVCGLSNSMGGVIAGRAIGGMGGAGMMTIASIVVTEVVPQRDLALWRSYVNLIMTLGRSLGGPFGGFLVDYLGWRWLFLHQVPFIALAFILVAWKMHLPSVDAQNASSKRSLKTSFGRIDYLGSLTAAISVIAGIFLLDMAGNKISWFSPLSIGLATTTVVFAIAFVLVEAFVAREPIFSLHLLRNKDVVLSYIIMPLQALAQMSMMFFVPLYFQVTARASNTVAGAHLAPAVAGNAVGGLLTGYIIRKTGRFKLLATSAGLIGSVCYVLLIVRWTGHTNVWESFYISPGGFGMGICQSVIFVAMTAAIEPKDIGMATSGLFQTMNISVAVGVTAVSSTLRMSLQSSLAARLTSPNAPEIIDKIMSDITYVSKLTGELRETAVACYVGSLQNTYYLSLISVLLSFLVSLFLTDRQL